LGAYHAKPILALGVVRATVAVGSSEEAGQNEDKNESKNATPHSTHMDERKRFHLAENKQKRTC
jgi:hypothetical protein